MCADYSDGFTCSSFVIILYLIVRFVCLLFWIDALRPSQHQWPYQDVAFILWDFYLTLGCHDTQNVLYKYNHPLASKPIKLICMDGLTKPRFLGRLRLERLISNRMVGQYKLCLEAQAAHLFLLCPNGRELII